MARIISFILILSTLSLACIDVEKNVDDAKTEMDSEIIAETKKFKESYELVIQQSTDNVFMSKVSTLHHEASTVVQYIDSLRQEMKKLDNADTRNVETIRNIFINNSIGDSVFYKIKKTYRSAIDLASKETTRRMIEQHNTMLSLETQKHSFELNSPLGVSMLLFGLELQLIQDVTQVLNDKQ